MSSDPIICVVDDDEQVGDSVSTFFRSAGIEVAQFESAEQLLAWPGRLGMRCLITDLHMPGLDGLALCERLNSLGSAARVILMTASLSSEARARAEGLGVDAFVLKPADPEALLEMVEALLGP